MENFNVINTITYMANHEGLKLPYDNDYIVLIINDSEVGIFTKQNWDKYQWNPPGHLPEYEGPDPDASPKPTWADLVEANRRYELYNQKYNSDYTIRGLSQHRTALTDAATIEHEGESLYVGAGLDHMTGLLQMVEQANDAGELCPHIVMRDGDQNVRRIWRGSQVRDILKTTAARENAVESAHNIIMAEYHAQAKIRDDDTQTLDDREAAATSAQAILDDYQARLPKNITSVGSRWPGSNIPVDEHKAYAVEYLEAAAMRKMKSLQGYTTNQGMMLHPTCFDQGAAAEKIAVELQTGLIDINRQSSYGAVKGWAQWVESKINKIEILNTPVFKINQLAPSSDPYPLDKLLVAADHPPGENIPGNVDIVDIKVTKGKLIEGFPKYHSTHDKTIHSAEIQIDKTQEARIVVRARNVCGVSRLVINMKPV